MGAQRSAMPGDFELGELRGDDVREYQITATGNLVSPIDAIVLLCTGVLLLVWGTSVSLAVASIYLLHRTVQCSSFVRQQSLVVIQEFGIQKTTTYASGKKECRFLAKDTIKDCVINEAFLGCSVVFYITFIVDGQQQTELAFDHFTPSLQQITPIFRGLRAVLFGELEKLPAQQHTSRRAS